jgi:hypothetical protein
MSSGRTHTTPEPSHQRKEPPVCARLLVQRRAQVMKVFISGPRPGSVLLSAACRHARPGRAADGGGRRAVVRRPPKRPGWLAPADCRLLRQRSRSAFSSTRVLSGRRAVAPGGAAVVARACGGHGAGRRGRRSGRARCAACHARAACASAPGAQLRRAGGAPRLLRRSHAPRRVAPRRKRPFTTQPHALRRAQAAATLRAEAFYEDLSDRQVLPFPRRFMPTFVAEFAERVRATSPALAPPRTGHSPHPAFRAHAPLRARPGAAVAGAAHARPRRRLARLHLPCRRASRRASPPRWRRFRRSRAAGLPGRELEDGSVRQQHQRPVRCRRRRVLLHRQRVRCRGRAPSGRGIGAAGCCVVGCCGVWRRVCADARARGKRGGESAVRAVGLPRAAAGRQPAGELRARQ